MVVTGVATACAVFISAAPRVASVAPQDARWTRDACCGDINLAAVDVVNSRHAVAVGVGGTIVRFDGRKWTAELSPTTDLLYDVVMESDAEGWAVGSEGTILRYANGSWASYRKVVTSTLVAVDLVEPGDGWAVGAEGVILQLAGDQWSVAQRGDRYLSDLDLDGPSAGWAVGSFGALLEKSLTGWTFAPIGGLEAGINLGAVAIADTSEAWAGGNQSTFVRFDGNEWSATQTSETSHIYVTGIATIRDGQGWAVAMSNVAADYGGYIFRLDSGTWREHMYIDRWLSDLDFDAQGSGFAVGDGVVMRYSSSWAVYLPSTTASR